MIHEDRWHYMVLKNACRRKRRTEGARKRGKRKSFITKVLEVTKEITWSDSPTLEMK